MPEILVRRICYNEFLHLVYALDIRKIYRGQLSECEARQELPQLGTSVNVQKRNANRQNLKKQGMST